mgnify:CR=1 FL=1
MSEVKTDKLSPRTGSGTVTLGTSGDTFTIPSGVTITNNGSSSGFDSGLASVQVFTSSGTWTKPSGVTKVIVEVQGAGAGGCNSQANSSFATSGSAGGYVKKLIDVSSISTSTITVGAKGTGSATRTGNDGGDSVWSDGTNTLTAGGGNGSDGSSLVGTAGGTATGGDLNIQGGHGACANSGSGCSFFGDGGKEYARDASGYGAGGAYQYNGTGGNGTDGIVIVTEYK